MTSYHATNNCPLHWSGVAMVTSGGVTGQRWEHRWPRWPLQRWQWWHIVSGSLCLVSLSLWLWPQLASLGLTKLLLATLCPVWQCVSGRTSQCYCLPPARPRSGLPHNPHTPHSVQPPRSIQHCPPYTMQPNYYNTRIDRIPYFEAHIRINHYWQSTQDTIRLRPSLMDTQTTKNISTFPLESILCNFRSQIRRELIILFVKRESYNFSQYGL